MSIVKVNVGGTIFSTTLDTLQKAKYFTELALQPDLSDVMIDRDPQAFAYLLNCLRDSRYIKDELLDEYQNEIDYFGIDCLRKQKENSRVVVEVHKESNVRIEEAHDVVKIINTQRLEIVAGEIIDCGIRVLLPFDGYVQLNFAGSLGYNHITANKYMYLRLRAEVSKAFDQSSVVGIMTTHRRGPLIEIRNK